MEQFFHRMHVRKQSLKKQTLSKKDQWKRDENAVKHGTCDFHVKYLGYTEVHESKGADICRHSFHRLKYDESGLSFAHIFHRNKRRLSTDNHQYATFHINGDAVRIIDGNDDIIVETTIARISFCCPISQHVKGFAFICRGEVAWKWNCYAMEADEDLGERLNHAVGCAFSICLEKRMLSKRQNNDVDDATTTTNPTSSQNLIEYHHQDVQEGSDFRKLSITDRQIDPQANIRPESRPRKFSDTTMYASVDRPHAPEEMKSRKGSLGDLMEVHPYKNYLKENINEEEMELRSSTDA